MTFRLRVDELEAIKETYRVRIKASGGSVRPPAWGKGQEPLPLLPRRVGISVILSDPKPSTINSQALLKCPFRCLPNVKIRKAQMHLHTAGHFLLHGARGCVLLL